VLAARSGDVAEAASRARELLRPLPGFGHGSALASALLTAAAPARLTVFDKRTHRALDLVGLDLPGNAPDFYAKYMKLIEQCRTEAASAGLQWSARDVDLALFVLGGQSAGKSRT
jgi:hypothetical protein